ncbi:gliding motility-associated C-terminal domain-containing protein [Pseudochryseolinea flava]|nr:gliding motility-associated C-terminal domain-containing protein [Pseudochryseolinea flava]
MSVILFFLACPLCAQTVFNGTSIYVANEGMIHLPAEVSNEGYFENNGLVEAGGDWINKGVYHGTGILALVGGDAQSVKINDQPFERLRISGGGVKIFEDKVHVKNLLTLEEGIVQFSQGGSLSLEAHAKIVGGSEQSYISGALTQEGVGYKFFPVGKGDLYRPFELLDVSGISPRISLELMIDMPNVSISGYTDVCEKFYWKRETVSGTFFSSPVSATYEHDDMSSDKVMLIQGNNFDDAFSLLATEQIAESGRWSNIISAEGATGNIFMLALARTSPVREDSQQYISTTLSPNATNTVNQSIKAFGDYLVEDDFHLVVFNRQGFIVFETTSLINMQQSGWRGVALNGSMLPSGAYPYTLRAKSIDGALISQKGKITILR